jgi:hypothetical protein
MAQNQVIYKDYSIDADLTSTGALKVLEGRDAVTNALKLWISSFRGEVMRDPSKGGYITRWLMKPISETTAVAIKRAILDGLNDEFYPILIPSIVDVIPNYEREYWEIHIEAYSPEFRENINMIENIRKLT